MLKALRRRNDRHGGFKKEKTLRKITEYGTVDFNWLSRFLVPFFFVKKSLAFGMGVWYTVIE